MAYPQGWRPVRYEQRCADRRAELDRALERAIATCAQRGDVVRLVVFGSYARGEVSPWSDLDLIVFTDGDGRDATLALYEAGTLGDVLSAPAADAPETLAKTPLGRTILAQGREVYARPAR